MKNKIIAIVLAVGLVLGHVAPACALAPQSMLVSHAEKRLEELRRIIKPYYPHPDEIISMLGNEMWRSVDIAVLEDVLRVVKKPENFLHAMTLRMKSKDIWDMCVQKGASDEVIADIGYWLTIPEGDIERFIDKNNDVIGVWVVSNKRYNEIDSDEWDGTGCGILRNSNISARLVKMGIGPTGCLTGMFQKDGENKLQELKDKRVELSRYKCSKATLCSIRDVRQELWNFLAYELMLLPQMAIAIHSLLTKKGDNEENRVIVREIAEKRKEELLELNFSPIDTKAFFEAFIDYKEQAEEIMLNLRKFDWRYLYSMAEALKKYPEAYRHLKDLKAPGRSIAELAEIYAGASANDEQKACLDIAFSKGVFYVRLIRELLKESSGLEDFETKLTEALGEPPGEEKPPWGFNGLVWYGIPIEDFSGVGKASLFVYSSPKDRGVFYREGLQSLIEEYEPSSTNVAEVVFEVYMNRVTVTNLQSDLFKLRRELPASLERRYKKRLEFALSALEKYISEQIARKNPIYSSVRSVSILPAGDILKIPDNAAISHKTLARVYARLPRKMGYKLKVIDGKLLWVKELGEGVEVAEAGAGDVDRGV